MAARVLVIDHFDSFTYNLVQLLWILGADVRVVRTDMLFSVMVEYTPTHLILSPGPGHPKDVPLFHEAIAHWLGRIPILGVCLGHQALALHCGYEIIRAERIMHGKTSLVHHGNLMAPEFPSLTSKIFHDVEEAFVAMRYHSLLVSHRVPEVNRVPLAVIAQTAEGEIMGLSSLDEPPAIGVQFHPESFYTPAGATIMKNFLSF